MQMGLIAGMFAMWGGWVLFSATFVGLGCVVLRVSTDPGAKWDIGTAFWSGFAVTISILQVSNLFSAIGLRGCLKSPGRSRLTVRGPGFAPAVWKLEWETKSVKYDRIGTFQTPS
jgi:hypothetical protein